MGLSASQQKRLNTAIAQTYNFAQEKMGAACNRKIQFSNRMTSTLGKANAQKGITLSAPILRGVWRDKGFDAMLDRMVNVLLHEIAHLYTPGDKHGPKWKAAMRKLGLEPNIYHHERCGARLYAGDDVRAEFAVGTSVILVHEERQIEAEVIKHNTKTFTVEDLLDGSQYRVSWGYEDIIAL